MVVAAATTAVAAVAPQLRRAAHRLRPVRLRPRWPVRRRLRAAVLRLRPAVPRLPRAAVLRPHRPAVLLVPWLLRLDIPRYRPPRLRLRKSRLRSRRPSPTLTRTAARPADGRFNDNNGFARRLAASEPVLFSRAVPAQPDTASYSADRVGLKAAAKPLQYWTHFGAWSTGRAEPGAAPRTKKKRPKSHVCNYR
jgi:hypothetical protein